MTCLIGLRFFQRAPGTEEEAGMEDVSLHHSTKTEMTNSELEWNTHLPAKEGSCLLGSPTPDNGRSEPSSDFISLSGTDVSQGFQHLRDV